MGRLTQKQKRAGTAFGRRPKHKMASLEEDDDHISSDDCSEPDLGKSLREQRQLEPKPEDDVMGATFGASKSMRNQNNSGGAFDDDDDPAYLDAEKYGLVIEATGYVVTGIVDHTTTAQQILFTDMLESREVFQGIGNVMSVLCDRARSLHGQQRELLKHF